MHVRTTEYYGLIYNCFHIYVAMIFGFGQRRQTVSEADAPPGEDRFVLDILITSIRPSEVVYPFIVRSVIEGQPIIDPVDNIQNPTFDGLFGYREYGSINNLLVIEEPRVNTSMLSLLQVTIRNDNLPEDEECFDLSISPVDPGPQVVTFLCNDAGDEFLCQHEICIEDDDG